MCIRVVRQPDRVEIWVPSNVDAEDLRRCIQRCRQYGMPIAIFRSGKGALPELTGMLLANNIMANQTENID